ncbi:hypothetical protein [Sporomusa sphaeroides]|uniref:YgiT-type zinc finger protein n=1 Tax=Sporomusa sphaeroides DSM 2875 TaxID=1337886 RepID=A0ABP2C2M7_9FIRM|nr:hypothetical protein [Sporomusa sphaeroides]OLS56413.1 hypothetical protein SPSPH_28060 [Sporomusa sphaeroides DSM 2875]CVK18508.1 hypothetical protein SSPH_01146 [Sporomusa sphaeroides DSM 2875]
MNCPGCGTKVSTGQKVVNIPLNDGSGVDILVTVDYCSGCDDYCEVDTELA